MKNKKDHKHVWKYNGYKYGKKFWKCKICSKIIVQGKKPSVRLDTTVEGSDQSILDNWFEE